MTTVTSKGSKPVAYIDPDKLRAEFKKRDLSITEVSRSIGYSAYAVSKHLQSGRMPLIAVNMLKAMYNIDLADYELVEKKEPVVEEVSAPETVDAGMTQVLNHLHEISSKLSEIEGATMSLLNTDENKADLYKIIYSAVYEAVKKALSE